MCFLKQKQGPSDENFVKGIETEFEQVIGQTAKLQENTESEKHSEMQGICNQQNPEQKLCEQIFSFYM